jgi:hypothetical protein
MGERLGQKVKGRGKGVFFRSRFPFSLFDKKKEFTFTFVSAQWVKVGKRFNRCIKGGKD